MKGYLVFLTYLIGTLILSAQNQNDMISVREVSEGLITLETNDNHLIHVGLLPEENNQMRVTKLTFDGIEIWSKKIRDDRHIPEYDHLIEWPMIEHTEFKPLAIMDNGNIAVVSQHRENEKVSPMITFLNNDGAELKQLVYTNGIENEIPISLAHTDYNKLALLYKTVSENPPELGILEVDSDGEKIFMKKVIFAASFNLPDLVPIDSNKYLISHRNGFLISEEGTKVDTLSLNLITAKKFTDTTFVGGSSSKLFEFKLDGTILWQKNVSVNNLSTKDGMYIQSLNHKDLITFDNFGNLIWEITPFDIPRDIRIANNGISFVTLHDNHILKINDEGSSTFVKIIRNRFPENFYAFEPLQIVWYGENIESYNLEFSSNGGQTWSIISEDVPKNDEPEYGWPYSSYEWVIPNISTTNALLKISSSSNPNLFIASEPFKITFYDEYEYIAANEVFMWIGNNGDGSHDPRSDGCGLYWPGGENATLTTTFEDGLVYTGKYNNEVFANGNTHRQGLVPGIILENGLPDNPLKIEYKIFKIKKDWETLPEGPIRERLEYDYNNWPAELGAPWIDNDGDGVFDREIDEPEFIGDEVLFYVSNGTDSIKSNHTYGSPPVPIEFQTTVWAYDTKNELKDVVFKKYKIINKGTLPFTDFYLSYWADDDLGFAGDDVVGCDSYLNLAYTWNGDNFDEDFYLDTPPAIGRILLQGPAVPASPDETAFFYGDSISGFKYLTMTSFSPVFKHLNSVGFPVSPHQGNYGGTLEIFNIVQGLNNNGEPIINPLTNDTTMFPLNGDPENATGWYEVDGWPQSPEPADRRLMLNTGPFTLEPGDTNEVVYAFILAQGTDHKNSVTELKRKAHVIREYYYGNDITNVDDKLATDPSQFELKQNYPNPFNPATVIEYSIASHSVSDANFASPTTLFVYDILGREVATLINKHQKPGSYKVEFDASKLASGIYIYQLKSGTNITSKKMVLMK